jgi:lipopolysaccharide biosynthesis regulator YciM
LLTYSSDDKILQEARKELLDIYTKQQKWAEASKIAAEIINTDTDNPVLLAKTHLVIAKNNLINNADTSQALKSLQVSATFKNEFGAQAQYLIAEIFYYQKKYDLTETTIYNLVKKFPGYDYWIAKGFILLSDNFLAKGDVFQAKVTLENLLKNYQGDQNLIDTAYKKLEHLKEIENQGKKQKQETLEIDLSAPQIKP